MKAKRKLLNALIALFSILAIYSCVKDQNDDPTNSEALNDLAKSSSVSLLNIPQFDHNARLNNILIEVKSRGSSVHIDTINMIYQEEFAQELSAMTGDGSIRFIPTLMTYKS